MEANQASVCTASTSVQQESQDRLQADLQASTSGALREPSLQPSSSPHDQSRSDSDLVHQSGGTEHAALVRNSGWKRPKMHPYNEGEDIEHYLVTFERIVHACQ